MSHEDQDGAKLRSYQYIFAEAYLETFDVGIAAETAGICAWYPDAEPEVLGRRMLRNNRVAAYIDKRLAPTMRGHGIERGRVLKEMARIAFFDPRKLKNLDGSWKELEELDSDTAAAILGIEAEEMYTGRGEDRENIGQIKKYKYHNKEKILALLGEHLGVGKGGVKESDQDRLDEVIDAIRNSPAGNQGVKKTKLRKKKKE